MSDQTIGIIVTAYCCWVVFALIVDQHVDGRLAKQSRFVQFLLLTGLVPLMAVASVVERGLRWLFDPATRR